MAPTTRVTYLFDPLCGWCYGASPMLDQLVGRPDLALEPLATGLFAGAGARPMDAGFAAFAWTNDQRIARLTGQVFSEAYRHTILGDHTRLFDSGPATLALTAVALTAPDRVFDALKAIQNARYVDGRDNTDSTVLAQILRSLGLADSASRLVDPDDALIAAYRARLESARAEMDRFGAGGVPALVAGSGDTRRLIPSGALFGGLETLVAKLQAA